MNVDIESVARILGGGGVAILPTDTIYGYHCAAGDKSAVARIAALKDRDDTKPFIVLGHSIAQLESLGASFTERSRAALSELWPGPLTAIVPLTRPLAASRGASTIGVRIPDLAWLQELLAKSGPLASTSVNRSGEVPLVSPAGLSRELQQSIDVVVDAGPLAGKASTIVDFTGDEPRFIREGEPFFTQKVWKTLRKSL